MQRSIEFEVHRIHGCIAAEQQLGHIQTGKLTDIAGVKVIDWRLSVQRQVQHRLSIAQPRIHGHKHSDNVLDLSQFLCTDQISIPPQDLGHDRDEIQARNYIPLKLLLKIDAHDDSVNNNEI